MEVIAGEFSTGNSGRYESLAIDLMGGAHRIHPVAQSRSYALSW
jgi:hypothetical protein